MDFSMKNQMKKVLAVACGLSICASMGVNTFAAEIGTNGGAGTTPVNLSSTVDGTIGGTAAPTALSVTVPTSLPMAMSQSGDVTTATNCQIINNSYGAVRVANVDIDAAGGWELTAFGDKATLAAEKVDSNKLGFAMSIGGGAQVDTDASDADSQNLINAPTDGCYMTGVNDPNGKNVVDIEYDAIATPLSSAVTDANVADVVFVVEWDTAQ